MQSRGRYLVEIREWGVVTAWLHALLPAPKRCVERVPMTLRTICTIGIAIIVDTALTWAAQRGHAQRYLPNTIIRTRSRFSPAVVAQVLWHGRR